MPRKRVPRFFTRTLMQDDNQDKDLRLDLDKPFEEPAVEPVAPETPEAPVEEVAPEVASPEILEEQPVEEVSDESATDSDEKKNTESETEVEDTQLDPSFNCSDCKGSGLLNERTVCPACGGTGKVS